MKAMKNDTFANKPILAYKCYYILEYILNGIDKVSFELCHIHFQYLSFRYFTLSQVFH